jgi:ABC-type amino acid transport substrate-binding protein
MDRWISRNMAMPGRHAAMLGVLLTLIVGCGDPEEGLPQPPAADEESRDRPVLAAPGDVEVDRGTSLEEARATGAGHVMVLFVTSEGWAYHDPDSRLTGVTVEILRDFLEWAEEREGISLEATFQEEAEWARFYRRVRNGKGGLFGIGNVTITAERQEELDFSPPYLNNVAVLITHADVPELTSMEHADEAFAGFVAYPFRGTLHEERVNRLRERRIPGLRVIPLDSIEEILTRVSEGPGRLAWVDVYNYWRASERGVPIRRHPVGDDASETLGFILPHGSDWTPLLREFFEEGDGFRDTSRYRELLETHLGPGLTELLEEARTGTRP